MFTVLVVALKAIYGLVPPKFPIVANCALPVLSTSHVVPVMLIPDEPPVMAAVFPFTMTLKTVVPMWFNKRITSVVLAPLVCAMKGTDVEPAASAISPPVPLPVAVMLSFVPPSAVSVTPEPLAFPVMLKPVAALATEFTSLKTGLVEPFGPLSNAVALVLV